MPARPRGNDLANGNRFCVVLVTAGSSREGRRLARILVRESQAACVNLLPTIHSWYWWKGRVVQGKEVLLLIKTRRSRLSALYKTIRAHHSYQVPEFLCLPIASGSRAYLAWLEESLRVAS